jgi:hypothetical protein
MGVVFHTMALSFTLKKSYLNAKEELYENSNISPCKNIYNRQKNPLKGTKILHHIITL